MKKIKGNSLIKKRAFTLIETLVVIFIIGVISAILVVNWKNNEKTYLVKRVAQEIVQNIRRAQDLALTTKNIDPSAIILSYGISFNKNDKNNYTIFGDVNGNNSYQTPSSDALVEVISINSEIEIYDASPGDPNLDIVFSIPDGFTTITPASSSAEIDIRRVGATCPSISCKTIIVNNTGQITIQ